MKDYVSRGIHVVLLSASLLVVGGVFMPAFPLTGLMFVSVAASLALFMANRSSTRSSSQVIWDVDAEPVRVTAPARGGVPAPKSTLIERT
jgi:hypothetical protein